MSHKPNKETMESENSDQEWDDAGLNRFATAVVQQPILLCSITREMKLSDNKRSRKMAVMALCATLGMSPQLVKARLHSFKKLFYSRVRTFARASAKRGNKTLQGAPQWIQIVEPYLRDSQQLKRIYSTVVPPKKTEVSTEAQVEQVALVLAAKARAVRSILAADVARDVPEFPQADAALLSDIWSRLVKVVQEKLEGLVSSGDTETGVDAAARLTSAEWRVLDAVVLHGSTPIVQAEHLHDYEAMHAFIGTFHLVQLFGLETGVDCVRRWCGAAAAYKRRGLVSSLLLLQRRWHDLKMLAREALLQQARATSPEPLTPFYVAIVRRYPHVVTEPMPTWGQLVAAGKVVENVPEGADGDIVEPDADQLVEPVDERQYDESALSDEEVIVVEKPIETIDLLQDDEPSQVEQFRGAAGRRLQRQDLLSSYNGDESVQGVADVDNSGVCAVKIELTDSDESRDSTKLVIAQESDLDSDNQEEDEEVPDIDAKILMTTLVPLVKVDSIRGWKRHSQSGTVQLSRLDLTPLSPKRPKLDDAPKSNQERNSELFVNDSCEIRIMNVKSEASSNPQGEAEESDVEEECGRVPKRVQLPDIAEVRRINQSMLTAQVAPLTTGAATATSDIAEEPVRAAGIHSARSSLDDAPNLYIDENDEEGTRDTLTTAELQTVLREAEKHAGKRGAKRVPHCCPARQHRSINDARKRNAARARRPIPSDMPLHKLRCLERRDCICCCAHLLNGVPAPPRLIHEQDRLNKDVDELLSAQPAAKIIDKDTQNNTNAIGNENSETESNNNRCTKKRKRRKIRVYERSDTISTNETCSNDPLQEWIRQKNITSRFFDLNLKQPPPSSRPAPVQPDPVPISSVENSSNPSSVNNNPLLTSLLKKKKPEIGHINTINPFPSSRPALNTPMTSAEAAKTLSPSVPVVCVKDGLMYKLVPLQYKTPSTIPEIKSPSSEVINLCDDDENEPSVTPTTSSTPIFKKLLIPSPVDVPISQEDQNLESSVAPAIAPLSPVVAPVRVVEPPTILNKLFPITSTTHTIEVSPLKRSKPNMKLFKIKQFENVIQPPKEPPGPYPVTLLHTPASSTTGHIPKIVILPPKKAAHTSVMSPLLEKFSVNMGAGSSPIEQVIVATPPCRLNGSSDEHVTNDANTTTNSANVTTNSANVTTNVATITKNGANITTKAALKLSDLRTKDGRRYLVMRRNSSLSTKARTEEKPPAPSLAAKPGSNVNTPGHLLRSPHIKRPNTSSKISQPTPTKDNRKGIKSNPTNSLNKGNPKHGGSTTDGKTHGNLERKIAPKPSSINIPSIMLKHLINDIPPELVKIYGLSNKSMPVAEWARGRNVSNLLVQYLDLDRPRFRMLVGKQHCYIVSSTPIEMTRPSMWSAGGPTSSCMRLLSSEGKTIFARVVWVLRDASEVRKSVYSSASVYVIDEEDGSWHQLYLNSVGGQRWLSCQLPNVAKALVYIWNNNPVFTKRPIPELMKLPVKPANNKMSIISPSNCTERNSDNTTNIKDENVTERPVTYDLSLEKSESEASSTNEEEVTMPRPSRQAAYEARDKLKNIIKEEEESKSDEKPDLQVSDSDADRDYDEVDHNEQSSDEDFA